MSRERVDFERILRESRDRMRLYENHAYWVLLGRPVDSLYGGPPVRAMKPAKVVRVRDVGPYDPNGKGEVLP